MKENKINEMRHEAENFASHVRHQNRAGMHFVSVRTAQAMATLDYIAQLEQTSRAQRTTESEVNYAAAPAAGQAGLATELQKDIDSIADELEQEASNYEGDFADTANGCADALRQIAERAAPVAADTEQAKLHDASHPRDMAQAMEWIVGLRNRVDSLLDAINTPLATPSDAGAGLTDAEITEVVRRAIVAGEIIWAGFKKDASGHYTIPDLSPADFKLARTIEREVLTRLSTPGAPVESVPSSVAPSSEAAVTACDDLHNAIMNLPCKPGRAIAMNGASKQAYQEGHRDARHAAAELVAASEDQSPAPVAADAAVTAEPVANIYWNHDAEWKLEMLCEPVVKEGVRIALYDATHSAPARQAESLQTRDAIRDQVLDEVADKIDAMNDSAGDRAAYENREMLCCEESRMWALKHCASEVRALKTHPSASPTGEKIHEGGEA